MDKNLRNVGGWRIRAGSAEPVREVLTLEAALQIKINGQAYTMTMRTPGAEKFLAYGLLQTEGIIRNAADITGYSFEMDDSGQHALSVDLNLPVELLSGKNLFNRTLLSNASCGICGKTDICDLPRVSTPLHRPTQLSLESLRNAFAAMQSRQNDFEATGGCHAAAAFNGSGALLSVHEDIGRHNAVDKVIGELLLTNRLADAELLCVSGRLSLEIAAKCTAAAIPVLAAVSAPSSLAVEFCRDAGITLIAFCRGDRATVYTHPERIIDLGETVSLPAARN